MSSRPLVSLALRGALCGAVLAAAFALPAGAADDDIVILIKDGKFVPSEVAVPADKKVKLIVRNQDKGTAEWESADLHREKVVKPGSEVSVFVGPLKAGSYEFFDDLHPTNRGHLVAK